MRTHVARFAVLVGVPLLVVSAACQSGPRREPVRDTWQDPDASIPMIDVAIAKPRVMTDREAMVAPALREAARRVMLDEKGYSVVSNEVVDAAMAKAGMDGSGDASAASSVVDADAVILIHITRWDTDYLIPNGRIYASGSIRSAARPNGRRVFEHTFQDEILLSPGPVSQLGRDDAEKKMAADLIARSLASFRKKS